ncbi:TPA: hypothetical protein ACVO37_001664 [Vibrio alginolyticus]
MTEFVWYDGEKICTVEELKRMVWANAPVPKCIYTALSGRDYWTVANWLGLNLPKKERPAVIHEWDNEREKRVA